jgi:hypothetical protein
MDPLRCALRRRRRPRRASLVPHRLERRAQSYACRSRSSTPKESLRISCSDTARPPPFA